MEDVEENVSSVFSAPTPPTPCLALLLVFLGWMSVRIHTDTSDDNFLGILLIQNSWGEGQTAT